MSYIFTCLLTVLLLSSCAVSTINNSASLDNDKATIMVTLKSNYAGIDSVWNAKPELLFSPIEKSTNDHKLVFDKHNQTIMFQLPPGEYSFRGIILAEHYLWFIDKHDWRLVAEKGKINYIGEITLDLHWQNGPIIEKFNNEKKYSFAKEYIAQYRSNDLGSLIDSFSEIPLGLMTRHQGPILYIPLVY